MNRWHPHPDNGAYSGDVALQHKKIGGGLEVMGKLPEALKEYVYALQIDEDLAAKHPEIASNRRGVAIDYSSVGDVLLKTGDAAAALKRYRQALTIDNELAAAIPRMRRNVSTLCMTPIAPATRYYKRETLLARLHFTPRQQRWPKLMPKPIQRTWKPSQNWPGRGPNWEQHTSL
jgi:tetratricopeptide (TPR) repeat protein